MDKSHIVTAEEQAKLKVNYTQLYNDGVITNPKIIDIACELQ